MGLTNKIYHQRGEAIMTQGVLPFKYEEEAKEGGLTALGRVTGVFGCCAYREPHRAYTVDFGVRVCLTENLLCGLMRMR